MPRRPVRVPHAPLALLAALALLASARPAFGQSADDLFHRAYYLEHERADLEGALALYREAATKGSAELRARAARAASALEEDLAAADFARLLPGDALAYFELSRPGERVEALLGQLGLLLPEHGGDATTADACARRYGVSPLLVRGLLGLRGAAVAITAVDPRGGPPEGVAVLHPGHLDLLRGLVETALPNGAEPAEPIGGFATYRVEGEVWVTLTERLVVASRERGLVAAVLERLAGRRDDSLAAQESLRPALELRGDDLLFFCVNAQPLLPLLHEQIERASRSDPGLATAVAFCDIDSLRGLTGRLGVGADGLQLDVALDLAPEHRNLAFNLLRKPTLERRTLELVPHGAAFFLATTLNEPAPPGTPRAAGEPIVTAMDFGREVFANVVDAALVGLPPDGGGPLPDVAAVVRVNDPRRSRALWNFVLGVAAQASGGASMEPEHVSVGGTDVERYAIGGVPILLAVGEDSVTLSPSAGALARVLGARASHRSVLDDAAFAGALDGLRRDSTLAFCGQVGRLAAMAEPHVPEEQRAELAPYVAVLEGTSLSVALEHTSTRLALHARLCGLPDLSGLAAQAIERHHGTAPPDTWATSKVGRAAPKPAEAFAPTELAAARSAFESIAHEPGRTDDARALGRVVLAAAGDDPSYLNDLAWALLTEERYRGAFDELALAMSKRSNELTGHSQWHFVDTLALAHFEIGEVERAIELEERALELVGQGSRRSEVERALERFRDARDNTGPIFVVR